MESLFAGLLLTSAISTKSGKQKFGNAMKNLKLMQGIKTGFSLVSINLVLAFIGLEVVSLEFYYFQEKQLFYTRKNTVSQVRE
ncbi:MAG: hypothetical protein F6K17_43210 [Okeania sp. SIO3C4]|nr:hypothetical protein [Okeania sp. SIO3C4]